MGSKDLIQDQQQIEDILSKAKFLRLALLDSDTSYIIPMAFGYKDNKIYLHCSREGKKIDILSRNSRVAFEADSEAEIITTEDICKYNVRYRSVVGNGQARFVEDYNEKVEGLTVLSEHYGKKGPFEFEEWKVNRLCIVKIEIEEMTGKQHGF
ncbi:pyridoxamine 5'-phosphate oxidase family protein [Methanosarcina sp. UBA5]|uniref:pyridoxamine 5'-phosphate oxidase family protein n=1 Tax=Methanosarcina sp. UBA5 TaxID=1915593 RepID=UPI0025D2927C|nr:pyridoxamine 5'-phosphate oxidase family protein [Methanosarcina sp. UBA5]